MDSSHPLDVFATYVSCNRAILSLVLPITAKYLLTVFCREQPRIHTDEAVPKLRVWLEVLTMVHHSLAQVSNGQHLLLVFSVIALRERLDVGRGGLVQLFHTW
jgi:hypothetical protein